MDKTKLLKIKIKSLAAEAQIIRHEERKAKLRRDYALLTEMHNHRVEVVRSEARVALMAYGLLRGKTALQIEPNAKTPVNKKRVAELMKKYGGADQKKSQLIPA